MTKVSKISQNSGIPTLPNYQGSQPAGSQISTKPSSSDDSGNNNEASSEDLMKNGDDNN